MNNLVKYDVEGDVATISMNDGKVNVMSTEMLRCLSDSFYRAEQEASAVVLRSGIQGIFSAGFDLKVFAANDAQGSLNMVRAGAELALQLLNLRIPTLGVMAGHAFPMGTFLLLACDVRLAAQGEHKMGLNEVAIQITPPSFAIELARSRLHPAWLSRTVTLGEMFMPEDALQAGFIDHLYPQEELDVVAAQVAGQLAQVHQPSHYAAKQRLRKGVTDAVQLAITTELTPEAYSSREPSAVVLPK